jgi:hypothetical protein
MKILLFASSGGITSHLIAEEIERAGHVLVTIVEEPNLLIHEIARTTPHLLVLDVFADALSGQMDQVRMLFPNLPVFSIIGALSDGPAEWQPALRQFLSQPIKPEAPRPYADDIRVVCHEKSLITYWEGKLNRPKQEDGWEQRCSTQEARYVLQLQAGRKNHEAAKRYYECLLAQQAGLDQELGYRIVHGSYKALSWSRDLAVKWLALLAHYVPDVELEYLPIAGTPGPSIDYVHHYLSLEGMYAAALIMHAGVQPSVDHAIKDLVAASFEGQDAQTLLGISVKLYGIAQLLQQVGKAQIELMDAWLDPGILDRAEDHDLLRSERRNAGIYRDFYGLNYIVHYPAPLALTLRGFHAGTTYVPDQRRFPTFADFRRLLENCSNRASLPQPD